MGHEDRPCQRGFTLLETLVALAILGMVLVTLFRLAGDTLAQYGGREAQLRLSLTAEAAFNAERLEPGAASASGANWPTDLRISAERRDFAGIAAGIDGLRDLAGWTEAGLDWLTISVEDGAGRRFVLEGVVARPGR